MSNLYTGSAYPKTSWVFDKIYSSLYEATNNANTDGVMVGRYILIMYCEEAFGQDKRHNIEIGNYSSDDPNENLYYENFIADNRGVANRVSRDRNVYRKAYDEDKGKYYYQLITTLRTDLSQETVEYFEQAKAASWDIIK